MPRARWNGACTTTDPNPWSAAQDVFDTERIDAVAKGSTEQTDDLDVAKAPAFAWFTTNRGLVGWQRRTRGFSVGTDVRPARTYGAPIRASDLCVTRFTVRLVQGGFGTGQI